jgi:hypothetical protein
MNWQAVFARDSLLWVVLFYLGMAVTLGAGVIGISETPEADYGLTHITVNWILLAAAVVTGIAGKAGMSPVELRRNLPGGSK